VAHTNSSPILNDWNCSPGAPTPGIAGSNLLIPGVGAPGYNQAISENLILMEIWYHTGVAVPVLTVDPKKGVSPGNP